MYTLNDIAASYRADNAVIEERMRQLKEQIASEQCKEIRLRLRRRYRALRIQSNDLLRTAFYLEHYYDKD